LSLTTFQLPGTLLLLGIILLRVTLLEPDRKDKLGLAADLELTFQEQRRHNLIAHLLEQFPGNHIIDITIRANLRMQIWCSCNLFCFNYSGFEIVALRALIKLRLTAAFAYGSIHNLHGGYSGVQETMADEVGE